jgi:hypothetical protein
MNPNWVRSNGDFPASSNEDTLNSSNGPLEKRNGRKIDLKPSIANIPNAAIAAVSYGGDGGQSGRTFSDSTPGGVTEDFTEEEWFRGSWQPTHPESGTDLRHP